MRSARPYRLHPAIVPPAVYSPSVAVLGISDTFGTHGRQYARVVLHVVFSTKNRVPFLKDSELRARLHAYMAGALQAIGCEPILINGVEDHVHVLCNLSRTVTIARK